MNDLLDAKKLLYDFLTHIEDIPVRNLSSGKIKVIETFLKKRGDVPEEEKKTFLDLDDIGILISQYFFIPKDTMHERTRKREVVEFRQWNMYFMKRLSNKSLQEIGDYCGKKDHATVLHAIKNINNLIETRGLSSIRVRMRVDEIYKEINERISKYVK